MVEVKWIKLDVDMFSNPKIKRLRRLPDGNNILLIWVMLLTMAGKCNASGMIFITQNIPYTVEDLADDLGFSIDTIKLALKALEELGMISTNLSSIEVIGWNDHQNIDGLEKIREQNRIRKQRQRSKEKLLPDNSHVTSRDSHATEEDIEEDIEKEKDNIATCKQVVELYHSICLSYPKVKNLSDARKKAINARLKQYSLDDFKTLFEKAEASAFLKGGNDKNWEANFDWLIKDANMAKVIDGNYDRKAKQKNQFNDFTQRNYDMDELEARLLGKG